MQYLKDIYTEDKPLVTQIIDKFLEMYQFDSICDCCEKYSQVIKPHLGLTALLKIKPLVIFFDTDSLDFPELKELTDIDPFPIDFLIKIYLNLKVEPRFAILEEGLFKFYKQSLLKSDISDEVFE